MKKWQWVWVLGLFLLTATAVSAHGGSELGPYTVIVGWEKEPPIVGERNAIVLEISKEGEPVTDIGESLTINIVYAGKVFAGQVEQTAVPGQYRIEILPTVRGQYHVQLVGTLGDTAVDATLEPEEVLPANTLQFPEQPADPATIQATIEMLAGRAQTAMIVAVIGLLAGLGGIGTAVYALRRQKKVSS
jgi:hypothetical protein